MKVIAGGREGSRKRGRSRIESGGAGGPREVRNGGLDIYSFSQLLWGLRRHLERVGDLFRGKELVAPCRRQGN